MEAWNEIDDEPEHLEQALEEAEPTGIDVSQRVVARIGIAIEPLRRLRILHRRIGTEELADLRIVDPPVHVNEPEFIDLLVTGVAPRRRGHGVRRPPGPRAPRHELPRRRRRPGRVIRPLAPRVEPRALQQRPARIRDRRDAAQVIPVQVAVHRIAHRPRAHLRALRRRDHLVPGTDIVRVPDRRHPALHLRALLVQRPDVERGLGVPRRSLPVLLEPGPVGAVGELGVVRAGRAHPLDQTADLQRIGQQGTVAAHRLAVFGFGSHYKRLLSRVFRDSLRLVYRPRLSHDTTTVDRSNAKSAGS